MPQLVDACWAVYLMCNFAYMQRLSEPLRRGEEHCSAPRYVHLPPDIEAALDIAIREFKPGQPTMRDGNVLFGSATVVFDADAFKFSD